MDAQERARSRRKAVARRPATEPPFDLKQLLRALQAVRDGDFSARLPGDQSGIAGKVADTFNDIVASNQRMARELERAGQLVGKDGKTRHRVTIDRRSGAWSEMEKSVNTLIDDLLWPTTEVTRTITAIAKGDLSQTVRLEVEGRPLKGEFLRSANIVNTMIGQLSAFTSAVTRATREVGTEGKLGGQAPVPGAAGTWKDLIGSVNSMAGNLNVQMRNFAAANERLERANTTLQAEKTRELEVLNHALQESNRHKDEFLAILAHELRNPLAPIRNAVDIMKRLPLQDASLVWSRDVIGRQAAHLTRLVDDLLDISRITHGTIKLNREVVAVNTIVDRALEAVQPAIDERRHALQVDLAEPGIAVSGDLIRLVQVLGNLLTNAAKYTPPGGRIALAVRRNGPVVEFRVADSGIGISADALPRLFNLFSRVPQQSGQSDSGLGIGLALVRRLAELHDGTVSARSEGENCGSEFLVSLPIVEVREPAADQPGRSGSDGAAQKRRILVVDDNLDALNSIALLLGMAGHEVFEAAGGLEGLKLAGDKRPDTAILDIGMPEMNGFELARRIRAEAWGKPMHLIALSGWGQHEDKRRAREAGFDHHLVKPVSFEAVTELLSQAWVA
jgi:signal transduction histidine kinase